MRSRCLNWVTVDRGRGLCRAAHFRFAPEADVELEYCYLSRWARSDILHCGKVGQVSGAIQLRGAFDPCVDFTAQAAEVDRLGQKRLSAVLKRLALSFRIANRRLS
jgi:hypothetical protein